MSKRKMRHAAQQQAAHPSAPAKAAGGTAPRADALADDAVLEGGPALAPQSASHDAADAAARATQPTNASPAAALDQPAEPLAEQSPSQPSADQPAADQPVADQPAAALDPLMHEVEIFLGQRAALARKLAAEIEATERKLAELKQTAARLFPEDDGTAGRERKAKKAKAKPAARAARPESSAGAEDRLPGGGG